MHKNEEKYKKIFEYAVEGIVVAQDGEWRLYNQATSDLLGYSEESFKPKSLLEYIHPDDQDLVLKRHTERLQGKDSPGNYQFRVILKDGSSKWVELHVELIPWDGKPASLCFLKDISKRVQAETSLKESEERYRCQNEYLIALHETTIGLINRLDINDLLQSIMERASSLSNSSHGYIFLLDPNEKEMILRVGMGDAKEFVGFKIKPGEGVIGQVWTSGRPIFINDYPSWPHRLSGEPFDRIHATLGIPLKTGDTVVGVIGLLYEKDEKVITDEDINDLDLFARLASISFENARLYSVVQQSLLEKTQAEEALQKANDELEIRVEKRTAELIKLNETLKQEIAERKKASKALKKRESQLKSQSKNLEEKNTALKVLLKQREDDKKELEANVLSNVKELVMPYLEKMKNDSLKSNQRSNLEILESNLYGITSPFIRKMSSTLLNLTPMEIKVANLIKGGSTNKEIAQLLFLSENTIIFHRHNIRTKLDIKNKKINLRSYLLSFDE